MTLGSGARRAATGPNSAMMAGAPHHAPTDIPAVETAPVCYTTKLSVNLYSWTELLEVPTMEIAGITRDLAHLQSGPNLARVQSSIARARRRRSLTTIPRLGKKSFGEVKPHR